MSCATKITILFQIRKDRSFEPTLSVKEIAF